MPRAALRKPRPDLDLKPWLLQPEQLPSVLSSRSLFANDRPLEMEIGSGKGLFIQTASAGQPDHNFLGIEIAKKYAAHASARLARAGQTNAKMLAGDATPLLTPARVADESLEAIHVYFPDPWWKKRHRKRRVLSESNVRQFSRMLRLGGRLHFWTDVLDYFELTVELIAEIAPELGVPLPEKQRESTHDLDFHTHFERRSRRLGIPVYRVRYVKRGPTG